MTSLLQDFRFGLRMLAKRPAFAAIAVLTLALGIGANTAIFSAVNAVLLRPLPYPHPDRLVMLWELWQGQNDDLAPADFLDIRQQNQVFTGMAGFKTQSFNMARGEGAGEPAQVDGAIVSANFFSVLGIQPMLGRGFSSADGEPGAARVVVLGAAFWQAQFGGNPSILGRKLLVNREPYTIIGVMPSDFRFPETAEIWVPPRFVVPEHPLRPDADPRALRDSHLFQHYRSSEARRNARAGPRGTRNLGAPPGPRASRQRNRQRHQVDHAD